MIRLEEINGKNVWDILKLKVGSMTGIPLWASV